VVVAAYDCSIMVEMVEDAGDGGGDAGEREDRTIIR
jgi:hypothetical protein